MVFHAFPVEPDLQAEGVVEIQVQLSHVTTAAVVHDDRGYMARVFLVSGESLNSPWYSTLVDLTNHMPSGIFF